MQRLVKLLKNSLYGDQIRREIDEFYQNVNLSIDFRQNTMKMC